MKALPRSSRTRVDQKTMSTMMATPLIDGRKQAILRWFLPAIGLTLLCASPARGQAQTRALPVCRLAASPQAVQQGTRVTFRATPQVDGAQYRFDFGDPGGPVLSDEATVVRDFDEPGTIQASVEVVKDGNPLCTARAVRLIVSRTPAPPDTPEQRTTPDTLVTVITVERIPEVNVGGDGDTLSLSIGDSLVVAVPELGVTVRRPADPYKVILREPPPLWPWWIVLLLALLLLLETYLLWRVWHYIPLLLRYRDRKQWSKMYNLIKEMPASLAKLALVRQQHAFALNRDGHWEKAEHILRTLLAEKGPSAETNGILGRVYKDRWEEARADGQTERAADLLKLAVETYLDGHNAHPENPYPGLNAQTLLEFYDSIPDWYKQLAEQVSKAAQDYQNPDDPYWGHATRLEVAVLAEEEQAARSALSDAVGTARVAWQIETTLNNLRLIREGRETQGEALPSWISTVEKTLGETMDRLAQKARSKSLIALFRTIFFE